MASSHGLLAFRHLRLTGLRQRRDAAGAGALIVVLFRQRNIRHIGHDALYLAGCTLRDMMFWVPQTGSIGLGLSILSYRGQVHFGLITDARLIPDPDAVARRFVEEFDKLVYLAMMGPWDRLLDADTAEDLLVEHAG